MAAGRHCISDSAPSDIIARSIPVSSKGARVSRTILDVDDELLAAAAKIFGTSTKRATVNAALEAAVNREKRREFADWIKSGGLPDLSRSAGGAAQDVA
jgi:Arc/MetJ family transcription regulator